MSSMRCVAYVSVALTALTLRVALRASRIGLSVENGNSPFVIIYGGSMIFLEGVTLGTRASEH